MRKQLPLLFLLGCALCGTLTAQDAMITGIFDGTNSPGQTPKGIEIYVLNDIPDLSVLQVSSANNGDPAPDPPETTLSGSAVAGDYLYLTNSASGFQNFFSFGANQVAFAMNVNGNDAMLLYQNGVMIDCYGQPGVDGAGQPWEYADGWSKRNHTNGPNNAFDLTEWQVAMNDLNGCATNPTCTGANQSPFPLSIVLPAELTDFSGESTPTGNRLTWTTTLEINNDFFQIQRSTDAKTWTPLDELPGNGTTEAETAYTYFDRNVPAGMVYYRLQQVDFDGTSTFFGPISVRRSATDVSVNIFPNPVTDILTLEVPAASDISITDVAGQMVFRYQTEATDRRRISTSDWIVGMYFVRIRTDSGVRTERIVKR